MYGSVPRNDSNCVPQGGTVIHFCRIFNPRDESTNLTVRWLRSTDMRIGTMPQPTEVVPYTQNIYELRRDNVSTNSTRDCSHGPVYRDTFSLYISNFTTDNNGYYWCQVVINGSFRQLSQYAWFYAHDTCEPIQPNLFYRIVDEAQCANVTNDTEMIITSTLPTVTVTATTTVATHYTLTTVTAIETESNMEPIIYVVGILSALTLFLGTFAILILLMLVRKRQKEHKQRKGKSFAYILYTNAFP